MIVGRSIQGVVVQNDGFPVFGAMDVALHGVGAQANGRFKRRAGVFGRVAHGAPVADDPHPFFFHGNW